jgi:Resolvase, N terminal domain
MATHGNRGSYRTLHRPLLMLSFAGSLIRRGRGAGHPVTYGKEMPPNCRSAPRTRACAREPVPDGEFGRGLHQDFPREGDGSAQRPARASQLLKSLAPGDLVTVTRIDRLARSTFDLFAIVKQIVEGWRSASTVSVVTPDVEGDRSGVVGQGASWGCGARCALMNWRGAHRKRRKFFCRVNRFTFSAGFLCDAAECGRMGCPCQETKPKQLFLTPDHSRQRRFVAVCRTI